jgi:adenylylsulfate kinase-like enzyme
VKDIPLAVISGPVGVGKTTIGYEVAEMLETRLVPHTFIDFDQLRYTWPRPPDDRWGNRLGIANLIDVWHNCRAAGSRNLIISYVVETQDFIERLQKAIPDSRIVTFQLSAQPATLQARVNKREMGSAAQWHINRAVELTGILAQDQVPCDYRIDTDQRRVTDIAAEIVSRVAWRG